MADYVEKWGDDIDSAVELALKDLKLTRDQVVVTVLEQPSKGFLGLFNKKLALVRVEKKSDELKKLVEKEASKHENKRQTSERKKQAENAHVETAKTEVKSEKTETVEDNSISVLSEQKKPAEEKHNSVNKNRENRGGRKSNRSPQMHTKFTITADDTDAVPAQDAPSVKFIEEIAENMGLNVKVNASIKDDIIYINLEGKDVGSMIGKRGQTLDAIQYLSSIVQNKNAEKHIRVIINAEKYREKREKTLQQLARRLAEKCIKTGKSVRLEPMNPYERKVIHSALQTHPRVTTRSEGVEPNRRVIIEQKK
jgi:spoIIIJ-associated protein